MFGAHRSFAPGGAMNWRLIFQLSLFGLAMGIATVFLIPSSVEPFVWLVIFVISAYLIAMRAPSRPFVHGVLVGLANSLWVTASHLLLFHQYIARHPEQLAMMTSMPMYRHPRLLMLLTGPVIGLVSGCVLGIFAVIAVKLLGARTRPPLHTG
jgi:hypothetical protein